MTGNKDDLIFKCVIFKFNLVVFSINAFKCTELHLTRLSCELTNIYKGHHNKVNTNWWWGAHCPTLVSFVSLVDPRPLCGLGESVKYRVSHCPNVLQQRKSFNFVYKRVNIIPLQFDEFFLRIRDYNFSSKTCWDTLYMLNLIEQDFWRRMETWYFSCNNGEI